jgi:hypothetical protein
MRTRQKGRKENKKQLALQLQQQPAASASANVILSHHLKKQI